MRTSLLAFRDKLFSIYESHRLKTKPFIIISNNCWGYELYNSLGREYNTPFIGLFLLPECYLRFLENFDECINAELKFAKASKYREGIVNYPIGLLSFDIEIHFLHYTSEEEALQKWNRRVSRLKKAVAEGIQLYFKLCDCENCSPDHLTRFHALPYRNKLSLGVTEFNSANHLYVPHMCRKNSNIIIDGARLYKKRYHYLDITEWILSGRISRSWITRIFALIS